MNEYHIDQETGEVLTPRTVFLRTNEFLKVVNPYESGRSAKFIKTKTSQKAKRRFKKLTSDERGMLSIISLYASPNTNILLGDGEAGQKGMPLTAMELCKIGGYSKTKGYAIIKSLIEKNVLGFLVSEKRRKAFIVNPDYYLNGRRPDHELMQAFRYSGEVMEDDD